MTYKPKVIDGVFFLETIINFELGAYNDVKAFPCYYARKFVFFYEFFQINFPFFIPLRTA